MERSQYTVDHLFFTGIPTVVAYHLSDWAAFFAETLIEATFDGEEGFTPRQLQMKTAIQGG